MCKVPRPYACMHGGVGVGANRLGRHERVLHWTACRHKRMQMYACTRAASFVSLSGGGHVPCMHRQLQGVHHTAAPNCCIWPGGMPCRTALVGSSVAAPAPPPHLARWQGWAAPAAPAPRAPPHGTPRAVPAAREPPRPPRRQQHCRGTRPHPPASPPGAISGPPWPPQWPGAAWPPAVGGGGVRRGAGRTTCAGAHHMPRAVRAHAEAQPCTTGRRSQCVGGRPMPMPPSPGPPPPGLS